MPTWTPLGPLVMIGEPRPLVQAFSMAGPLTPKVGTLLPILGADLVIVGVAATVGVAPQGGPVVLDVNVNGQSVYSTQTNRPTIADGATSSSSGPHDELVLHPGDTLSVDVDQVGAGAAGADLTVAVWLRASTGQ